MLKKFWLKKLMITILVLVYLLCMVKGVLSYNEELVSSFVYIVLFFIFYKESLHFIKKLVKKQILNILIYYKKLTCLKIKNMYKSLIILNSNIIISFEDSNPFLRSWEKKKAGLDIYMKFFEIALILCSSILVLCILLIVAYTILLERKVLATIQKRRGPNYVGFFGLLQPIADAIKLGVKEIIVPANANNLIFILAPLFTLILSLLSWCILPIDENTSFSDINLGLLFFFAISGITVYGILMAGWSSNSKYAFLGCLRAAAQLIAYEVGIGITLLFVILNGSINLFEIIRNQEDGWNCWYAFFFFELFMISGLAETNRPPFDLPEAEAELVSGYNVEYSGMSFGFFFLGEYIALWSISIINIIIFFGGYYIYGIQNIYIYILKILMIIILFIWIRGSVPRYRYDQLMRLGWKIILPLALSLFVCYVAIDCNLAYVLEITNMSK